MERALADDAGLNGHVKKIHENINEKEYHSFNASFLAMEKYNQIGRADWDNTSEDGSIQLD